MFLGNKKAYSKCILGLVLSLLMNIGLDRIDSKVGLG